MNSTHANTRSNCRRGITATLIALAVAAPSAALAIPLPPPTPLPDLSLSNYIVVLKGPTADVRATAAAIGGFGGRAVGLVYQSALSGFTVKLPAVAAAQVAQDPRVQFVSPDRKVQISPLVTVGGSKKPKKVKGPKTPKTPVGQQTPSGIGRIGAPRDTGGRGSGIGVAVIDTGIDLTHPDLAPNIVANTNCVTPGTPGNDDHGHGTHVAGTIAAANNTTGVVGVAPEAKLIAVKVLAADGWGTSSQIICGIDWVTANAARYNIKVANMSIGGPGDSDNNCGRTNQDAYHLAICNSTAAGITYVAAAGNDSQDAANSAPAAYDDTVITVSALADSDGKPGKLGDSTSAGSDDAFASFSNYGSVVDLAAPGVDIYSTAIGGGYTTMNGTSMAAPHVSGAAARYLQANPGAGWSVVRNALVAVAETSPSAHTVTVRHPEPVLQLGNL